WWKVDLQAPVQSAEVILYFRTDYITRRNGVQLYTSEKNSREPKEGNLCHTVTGRRDGRGIPDVLDVTCRGTWRYLTVYTETNNDGNGAMLDFAEVQVWTCSADMYGANCNKSCNSRHCYGSTDSCDSITGACSSGMCQMGWTGTDCAECPNGKYGANCAKECSSRHCKTISSACDLVSGACPEDGCEDGWMGSDCSTECSTGKYGVMCGKECSSRHCKTSSTTCDHISGACPDDGCEAGWMGQDCTLACASGKYGANCTRDCSSRHCNISSLTCDQISGACPSGGCNPGWMGTDCATGKEMILTQLEESSTETLLHMKKFLSQMILDYRLGQQVTVVVMSVEFFLESNVSGGPEVPLNYIGQLSHGGSIGDLSRERDGASVDKRAVIGGTIGTVLLLLGIGQCIYLRKHERLKADRTKDGVSGTEDIEAIPIPAEEEEYYAELKEEYVGPVPIPAEEDEEYVEPVPVPGEEDEDEEYVEPVPVPGEEDEEYVEPVPVPGEEDEEYVEPIPGPGEEDEEYVEPIPGPGEEDEEYVEPIPGPGEEDEYYDDCRS
ncbi:uncharacterized protein, partial [Haliotis asinina]|uniref:uncharacterized protein n=1 Tax=Haliotis asinina TaxID=109174 RepID=UPI0035326E46